MNLNIKYGDPRKGNKSNETVSWLNCIDDFSELINIWLKENPAYIEVTKKRRDNCDKKHPIRVAYFIKKSSNKIIKGLRSR